MIRTELVTLVHDWFAAWPHFSDAELERFVAADFVNHPSPPDMREGRDAFSSVIRFIASAAPDQRYDVEKLVVEAPEVVALVRWSGTLTDSYLRVPGTGKPFSTQQIHIFRVDKDRRLAEHWAVRDDLGLLRQVEG